MDILIPKLITVFKEKYTWNDFYRDALAGIVVGIVALPLSLAFAMASGVQPEQGLYTAIVAGFIISALSGSRVQIGGPTGAFIVIVYNVVKQYGYEGLVVATFMAGVILILMGLARFGKVVEFIPYPITVGFTSGIAVIIFTAQLQNFLGFSIMEMPPEFIGKLYVVYSNIPFSNPWSVIIGLITVFIILQTPKHLKRVPGSILAIILTTLIVAFFHIPVETVQMRFGEIPTALPTPHFPQIQWRMLSELIMPATTIALLAGLESLLSAVVADGMTGFRHRSNMELIAQGVANIGSALFGGIPATGAIARTATNIRNGGRSPIAGMIHALTLLFILMAFGKWAALIPIPTLAAILIVVAYNMSEWRIFIKLFQGPKGDILVLLTTFLLTILIDLVVAIQIGFILAAFLFMKRMVEITQIEAVTQSFNFEEEQRDENIKQDFPPEIEVFEINGPFFFGAANKFTTVLKDFNKGRKILILRMENVPVMDATGVMAFENIIDKIKKNDGIVILLGVQNQPMAVIQKFTLDQKIGKENIVASMSEALVRVNSLVKK